jgi:hypothetical protein
LAVFSLFSPPAYENYLKTTLLFSQLLTKPKRCLEMWKAAPLKSSFMLAAILGLIITTIYTVSGRISTDWGVALGIVFACMFFASMIAMRRAPIDAQLEYSKTFVHAAKEPRFAAAKPRKAKKKPAKKKPARKKPAKKAKAKPKKAKKKTVKKKAKPKKAKKKPAKKKPTKKKPVKKAKKKPAKKAGPKKAKTKKK